MWWFGSPVWRLAVEQPLLPVTAHVVDHRYQRPSLRRQAVLDARRDLGIGAPLDDALRLERPQPERQRAWADPFERPLELAEAVRTLGEVTNDEERPFAGDDLRGLANGAGLL